MVLQEERLYKCSHAHENWTSKTLFAASVDANQLNGALIGWRFLIGSRQRLLYEGGATLDCQRDKIRQHSHPKTTSLKHFLPSQSNGTFPLLTLTMNAHKASQKNAHNQRKSVNSRGWQCKV